MDPKIVFVVILAVAIVPRAISSPLSTDTSAQLTSAKVSQDSKEDLRNTVFRYIGRKFGMEKQARFLSGYCDLNSYLSRTTASIAFIPLCAFLFSPFFDSASSIIQS